MKFKILVFSIALVCAIQNLYAQNSVGIGTETPNQNAVLELIAINGNQGFLAPRLTAAERTAFAANLTATDNGMLVFDSDDGTLYVWYNAGWNAIGLSQFVAGDGISIVGQEITNSGDIDATDDVTITTASAGDVLGRFDSLVVSGLKGLPLDSIAPSTGFSLVWNGSLWKFALDSASNQTVIPNANLLATNTQAALEELQVEILSITTGPNSIGSAEIIDGSIVDTDISATAAIAGTKVNPNFGTQNVITTGTVTGASFSGDGSGLTNIPATPGPNTVGSPEVIDGSIADADVNAAAAIAGTKVTPDFGAQNISTTGSVTASSFSGDGSGLTNIPATPGPNTVSSAEVIDGSIAFSDLNTAVVDGVTLASNGSSFEVRDNGVTTAKLVNGSVTDAKVSDVAPAKITQSGATNGQVLKWTGSAWAPAADVTGLASLTNGTLLIGDGTNTPQEQVITGHITVDNTGIAQIQSAVITHDMVNDLSFVDGITLVSNGSTFEVPAGGISSLEILDGTISDNDISDVDAGKIIGLGTAATLNVGTGTSNIVQLDGTGALPAVDGSNLTGVVVGAGSITTAALANNAVTNTKIATDAVSSDKIVNGSVITEDLADGNVTNIKIANNAVTSDKISDGAIVDADIADVSAAKVTGLGTAATLDAGVTTNDLVQLPSDGTLPALDGSALVNMSAAQISGLGTAAALNVGTAANNVVQLDGGAKLPAVEGSQLTNVTAVNFTGALAGDVAGGQGTTIISNGAVSGGTGGKIADNTITDDDINSISTAVITGLGTAAGLNVGVSPGNVVQLDATGLPAVDGSQLTNVTATGFTGSLAGDVTGTQGATLIANNAVTDAKLDKSNIPLSGFGNPASSVNMGGQLATNLGTPVSSTDAATKGYVDLSTVVFEDAPTGTLKAGVLSGDLLTSGQGNVLYGRASGGNLTTESHNTIMGWLAGATATSSNNSFYGYRAGVITSTGADNTYLGYEAGDNNVSGSDNVAIGSGAGSTGGTFSGTVAIGASSITIQDDAIAVGTNAIASATNAIAIGANTTAANANTMILGNGVNVGIGAPNPAELLEVNGGVKIGNTAGTNAGTLRWTGSEFQGYDGSGWLKLDATGIDGSISQDITFDQGNDREISIASAASGVGNDLILTAGDGATNSDVGGDIVLNPGIQPGFLTPSNVLVNGKIYFNGPSGSPVAYANGDFQLEQGANRAIQVGNAVAGNGNNLTVSAGGGQQFGGATNGGNLTLKAGSPWSGGLFGDIFLQGNRVSYGAADGTYKVEFSDGTANGSVFSMLSLTNNNLGGIGTGVALSFRGSTNGSNRFDLGKISALKTTASAGGMRFSVLTNTAGPTYVDAMAIDGFGRVGIGTTTPGEVLEVNGNIQATEYFYPSAVTKILSVSNKSFTPESNEPLATQGGTLGKYIVNGTATVNATMSAGIELPNGATVTQVDAFVIDNDATYNVTVQLARGTHTATGGIAMTNVTSAGQNPAVQNLSETFINAPLIDNDLYFYYLSFQTKQANSNLALLSFRIYYTVQKVD
ncbi:MAG: hypothetical protein RIG68_13520 [Imperialibacter sp.]|uniref:beta strand repeat-containing protein n=1 Tax=Imperialibacter sp. TaxID=2038411 RepID=UPI0032EBAC4F